MHIKRVGVALMAAAMIGTGVFSGVSASGLGSILGGIVKVGGIGFLVDKYGESLNSAINSVMMKEGAGTNMLQRLFLSSVSVTEDISEQHRLSAMRIRWKRWKR